MLTFMKGFKTYTGIFASFISTILILTGVVTISAEEINGLFDLVIQAATLIGSIGGLLFAWYGRYKATP